MNEVDLREFAQKAQDVEGMLATALQVQRGTLKSLQAELHRMRSASSVDFSMQGRHSSTLSVQDLPHKASASSIMILDPYASDKSPEKQEDSWDEADFSPKTRKLLGAWERLCQGLLKQNKEVAITFCSARAAIGFSSQVSTHSLHLATRYLRPAWSTRRPRLETGESKYYCVEDLDGDATSPEKAASGAEAANHKFIVAFLQRFVANPTSFHRLTWEILGLTSLMYDIITMPLEVFDYGSTDVALVMRYVVSSYWGIDLLCSFMVGYMDDGVVVMDILKVWRRYLMSWFFVDLLVVVADWALLLFDTVTSPFAFARLLKANRFARLFRLLRVARRSGLFDVYSQVTKALCSEMFLVIFNVIGLMVMPLLLTHYVACAWYFIGTELDGEDSWVHHMKSDDMRKVTLYWICLHWAMAQYTPAPHNVHPVTLAERVFVVVVLLLGFVFFTSFLGSVTSMVTAARQNSEKRLQEDSHVRKFIRDHRISFRLSHEVMAIAKQHNTQTAVLVEGDIQVFKSLPESVLVRLRFEVHACHLQKHPAIDGLGRRDSQWLVKVANFAARSASYGRFADIFNFGYVATGMVFVTHGILNYRAGSTQKHMTHGVSRLGSSDVQLGGGSHLCEPALWLDWHHQGHAFTVKWCNVIQLEAKEFSEICLEQPRVLSACREYAWNYFTLIVEYHGEDAVDILGQLDQACRGKEDTDLPPFTDIGLNYNLINHVAKETILGDMALDVNTCELANGHAQQSARFGRKGPSPARFCGALRHGGLSKS